MKILDWLLRVAAVAILLQTLYFKFLGAEESVFIFSTLGVEPWGRYLSGVAEAVASLLLLAPKTVRAGAILAIGIMCGAILSHLAVLGIEVQGDGGLLFGLAVVVLSCCAGTLWIRRRPHPKGGP